MLAFSILSWLGLLLVVFAAKSGIHRRWPATALWKPRDRDQINRVGTAILVPIAGLIVVLYAAPACVFDRLSGGRLASSWAVYTAEFQHARLPWLIGLLVALLALRSFAALQGRWSWRTRRVDICLNLTLALVVLSFAVSGGLFQSSKVDQIAQSVLALVAAIYLPCVGAQIYGEIGRVDANARLASSIGTTSEPRG